MGKPSHGSHAEHFREVSTPRLISEMQRLWPTVDDEDAITAALAKGEYGAGTFLVTLHERADRSVFDAAAALVHNPDTTHQIQGLRILRELGHPDSRPLFPDTWDLVEPLADNTADPKILYWALAVMSWTGSPRALPHLLRFVGHAEPRVRSGVADGLLGCVADVNDPTVVEALIRLSDDPDPQVRWDALWEAMQFLDRSDPVIEAIGRRRDDPDDDVRILARRDPDSI